MSNLRQKRRKSNDNWQQNKTKKLRNSGEQYVDRSGNKRESKKPPSKVSL